jgi:DnaJ-domain-containing protein 1
VQNVKKRGWTYNDKVMINLQTELLLRLGISLFLVFVIGKVFAAFLPNITNKLFRHGQQKNVDIDILIARQEEILRAKSGLSGKSQKDEKNKKLTEEDTFSVLYMREFNYLRKQEKTNPSQIEDVKKVLNLCDNLKWGEGKTLREMKARISPKLNGAVELSDITLTVRKLIIEKAFFALKSGTLPTFVEIEKLVTSKIMADTLVKELNSGQFRLAKKVARTYNFTPEVLSKALEYKIALLDGIEEELALKSVMQYQKSGDNIKMNKKHFLSLGISSDQKRFLDFYSIIKGLKNEMELIEIITPVPSLKNKNDVETALKIFGLKKESSLEQLKVRFKQMALVKHPDKLASKNLSPALTKRVHNNFTQIQSANDLLKSILKKEQS